MLNCKIGIDPNIFIIDQQPLNEVWSILYHLIIALIIVLLPVRHYAVILFIQLHLCCTDDWAWVKLQNTIFLSHFPFLVYYIFCFGDFFLFSYLVYSQECKAYYACYLVYTDHPCNDHVLFTKWIEPILEIRHRSTSLCFLSFAMMYLKKMQYVLRVATECIIINRINKVWPRFENGRHPFRCNMQTFAVWNTEKII